MYVLWRWLNTWKLERSNRVLKKNSGQHTASKGASQPRRATGFAETAGAGRWVSSESVPTQNPRHFHYLEQGYLQEKFPRFNNMCIIAVLLYQCRHCRRLPWEKRKIRDCDHSTLTLTQTPIGMLWGDQCLHGVVCDDSRLIRPIWLLCLARLYVDSAGPDAVDSEILRL